MRVLSLALVLSTMVIGSACDRAAADDELDGQVPANSLSEPTSDVDAAANATAAEPRVVREVIYRDRPAQPEPRVVTETNIKRDAAIGAGVGAVAGAIINDDNRVKGGVVGAVLGGAAGAAVGATIDKDTRIER